MRYAKAVLNALRMRARWSGTPFMTITQVCEDLGGPADLADALEELQAKGLVTLHRESGALTLTFRGRDPMH